MKANMFRGYIRDAPLFDQKPAPTGTLEKKATGEKFKARFGGGGFGLVCASIFCQYPVIRLGFTGTPTFPGVPLSHSPKYELNGFVCF